MSSVEPPEFVPEMNDHRSSDQIRAREARVQAVAVAAERVFAAAERRYVAGGRRSRAQDAIDASEQAWKAAHPEHGARARARARRDADAVHLAASQDLDELQARRDRESAQARQARRGVERSR
ncbi:hypothetical protein [Nocardia sp. NPDC005366]|uniref:hypothetical protein n=1 Tax=Nocardia sp. NPDC005366 TaxID=3156878 RepID=UPI0033AE6F7F